MPRRLRGRATVQSAGELYSEDKIQKRTVQFGDRQTVQLQIFRASMKSYVDQKEPFIVGDRYWSRCVVLPLPGAYRYDILKMREDLHAKLDAVIDRFCE